MSADVILLPTAADHPVTNQRRRGSYGRKIVSFRASAMRRRLDVANTRQENDLRQQELVQTLEWLLQEARRGKLQDLCAVFRHGSEPEMLAAFTGACRHRSTARLDAILQFTKLATDHC